jgi:predicted ATPase/DNA-binding CsgD family transcriptional regulator
LNGRQSTMARSIPKIRDNSLHVPTLEGNNTSIIALGSAAWDSWVEHARSFRFEGPHASFTARKEQRSGGWYWYAYRRRHGTLHIAYLGKSEELSIERLHTVAVVLERADDSSEETSRQSQPRSLDTSLQTQHRSIIPSPLTPSVENSQPEARPVAQHNLPIQVTSLVGREAMTATATALLRRPEVRLLSLIGTGGIGKTRLAIEVATQLLDDFTDGISFVALAPLRDPDLVLPTIAYTLGLQESGSEPVAERLHTYLCDKHLLLVLDNFEHLMPAASVVGELLTTCPYLTLLVTSREVLHLRAEQQFSVPPLAVPDRKHVARVQSLNEYPALDLFLQRARAVKHEFQLHESNAQALAEICSRLDGLPLAIELAAARITILSPQALLARLDHRLQVLTHGPTDLPERQQTLRQTIQWSYELLKPEEQRLFQRMSVFAGGATLEAVEAVCEALGDETAWVFNGVTSLLDKSLLQQTEQEGEQPRLTMLETIREYGLECLATSDASEVVRHAHAAYYLQLAQEAALNWFSAQEPAWLTRVEWDQDNLRTALNWLLERAEERESIEMALRLGAALWWFWVLRSHRHEGWNKLSQALVASEGVAAPVRAKALWSAGNLAGWLGHSERGEVLCRESLALFRALGDRAGMGNALFHLGVIADFRKDYGAARTWFEQSLVLSREVGDKAYAAWTLDFLADEALAQGEYARVRTLVEESLVLFRELGYQTGIGALQHTLLCAMFFQGELARAQALAQECLEQERQFGTKQGEAGMLAWLGEVMLQQGDASRARLLLEQSYVLVRQVRDEEHQLAWTLSLLGKVAAVQGDYPVARALYEESLKSLVHVQTANSNMIFLDIATVLEGLAAVVAAEGDLPWAVRLWGATEALRETRSTPLPPLYRADYERSVAAACAQLGKIAFVAAWKEGRTMTAEQALAAQGRTVGTPNPPAKSPTTYPSDLTAREVEVLRLVAQGLTDEQVAEQLVISRHTVNSHLKAIYGKLGISSRHAATHYALQHHLL